MYSNDSWPFKARSKPSHLANDKNTTASVHNTPTNPDENSNTSYTRRDIYRLRERRQQMKQGRIHKIKSHREARLKKEIGIEYQQCDVSDAGRLHPLPQKVSLPSINDIQRMCYSKLEQHNTKEQLNQWRRQQEHRNNNTQPKSTMAKCLRIKESDAPAVYHLLQDSVRQHVCQIATQLFKKPTHSATPSLSLQNQTCHKPSNDDTDGVDESIPIHPELLAHYRNKWCSISSLSHQQNDGINENLTSHSGLFLS
ncbi:hypothetical protein RFI_09786 [Reticulomyxa filosa]|uniref:Uncharacterized protein n=1 Tax=Reticulomyxa filosa TaxID=46433 RepID=X6NN34_RETFI|nr:hypothetical protein RFI_09786 [Reticulomyxa filosa]|eukprot:ETO27348.1 hypothetical protein RFI_09786 [Reticulomyxa filosa]